MVGIDKHYECILQQEINTNTQWEVMLENDGLTVIDVYSDWSGPCSAMKTTLRRIRHRLREYTLNFATASSDKIKYLDVFKGRCQPTWLFIAGRQIVNVMHGANAPKLQQMVVEEVKKEIAVKAGIRDRADLKIEDLAEEEDEESYFEEVEEELPEIVVNKNEWDLEDEMIYRPF